MITGDVVTLVSKRPPTRLLVKIVGSRRAYGREDILVQLVDQQGRVTGETFAVSRNRLREEA